MFSLKCLHNNQEVLCLWARPLFYLGRKKKKKAENPPQAKRLFLINHALHVTGTDVCKRAALLTNAAVVPAASTSASRLASVSPLPVRKVLLCSIIVGLL